MKPGLATPRPAPMLACALAATAFLSLQGNPPGPSSSRQALPGLIPVVQEVMRREGIPGMAIAIAREGHIVWDSAFGIANVLTRRPVTRETAFPVASVGKPVAAFVALQMVESGAPDLDQPLNAWLASPWLPDSAARATVTLRHVLTHTSGLSNFLGDRARRLRFPAGERYLYSGVGFMYLQAAVEAWGGAPLDSAVQTYAFAPLAMDHSFFGRPKAGARRAAGHVTVGAAVVPGLVVFLPVAALLAALLLLSHRAVMGVWWARPAIWLLALTGAWAIVGVFLRSRASQPGVVWFFVAVPAALTALAGAAGLLAGRLARREAPTDWPPWGRAILGWGATGLTTVLVAYAATPLLLPVPRAGNAAGNAAASLSATAVDVARFGVELGSPSRLGPVLSTELVRPQVSVSDSVSWGLGVGIAQGPTGSVLYHWGSNPSVRSLLLVHPGERWVMAVLANRDASRAGFGRIVKAATGGWGPWMTN